MDFYLFVTIFLLTVCIFGPWFLALIVNVTPGFALYNTFMHVYNAPEKLKDDASFGFSVSSVFEGPTSRLIIGAPLADSTGKVYTCDLIDNNNNCTSIPSFKRSFDEIELNHWFGATVMGTDNFFVSCAPRVYDKSNRFVGEFGTFGRCFAYEKSTPKQVKSLKYDQRLKEPPRFEFTMDSFGWSLFLGPNESILIGGPAMVSGRVIKTQLKSNHVLYSDGTSSNTTFNFGYAVTSGNFFSNKTSIAVGSPYGTAGLGKVIFLAEERVLMYKLELIGPAAGSMFGAVLCPVKLKSKEEYSTIRYHQMDLLVGAPTFTPKEIMGYNIGAVYVYITEGGFNKVPILKRIINGASTGSFFGSAVISLGDLNNDDIDEIAIAAPYENEGQGTVYLYSGADIMADGVLKTIQKITPEDLAVRSFGYSLSALRDYDDNGCNELAIGAPESNKVMVLRCPAAITIKLMEFESTIPGIIDGKDTTVSLPLCFNATFPDKPHDVKADIQVQVHIYHDSVKLAFTKDSNVTFQIRHTRANRKTQICQNISLLLSGETGANYNKAIDYYLSATLLNDPLKKTDFISSEVILNEKNSVISLSKGIWVQECGNRTCEPKLNMTTEFSTMSPYQIGSSPSINASIKVDNTGEVAYDPCVRINVKGVDMPDVCKVDENKLLCKPKQLLRENGSWSLETIVLDTSKLTNKDKTITVTVELFNECEKIGEVADRSKQVFQLYADADSVEVNGRTNEGQDDLVNLTRTDISMQKTFEHVYTISNRGPTNWVNIPMTIRVQKQDFFTVFSIDKSCKAMTPTDPEKTLEYSCSASKLNSNGKLELIVRMKIVSYNIKDRIGKEKLTVYSELTLDLNRTFKNSSITSELRLVEGKIPIWIIIVASIIALILLIIIFFILRECGFLKRKNKEQLKQVRMSVRRQTVLRKSMAIRPPSENEEDLINDANTIQENKKKQKDRRVVIQ